MITTRTAQQIQAEISTLLATEVCVETNEGTYSAIQAMAKCRVGNPQFANRYIYETVGGARREQGMDADRAPGYMRKGGYSRLAELRRDLAKLRAELKAAK